MSVLIPDPLALAAAESHLARPDVPRLTSVHLSDVVADALLVARGWTTEPEDGGTIYVKPNRPGRSDGGCFGDDYLWARDKALAIALTAEALELKASRHDVEPLPSAADVDVDRIAVHVSAVLDVLGRCGVVERASVSAVGLDGDAWRVAVSINDNFACRPRFALREDAEAFREAVGEAIERAS